MKKNKINPSSDFYNCVIGENNQKAFEIGLYAVKNNRNGDDFIHIYGEIGSGKSYLLHTIKSCYYKCNPHANLVFATSESFCDEIVRAIRTNKFKNFRYRYLNADLLIFDDIQFLAGKEATQQELNLIFNERLREKRKSIVTSDVSPGLLQRVKNLKERNNKPSPSQFYGIRSSFFRVKCLNINIISKLLEGKAIELAPPDLKFKTAMIRQFIKISKKRISEFTINFIAQKISGNVASFKGKILQMITYAAFYKLKIDRDFVDYFFGQ